MSNNNTKQLSQISPGTGHGTPLEADQYKSPTHAPLTEAALSRHNNNNNHHNGVATEEVAQRARIQGLREAAKELGFDLANKDALNDDGSMRGWLDIQGDLYQRLKSGGDKDDSM